MKTVLDFARAKKEGHKVSMVTTYDFWTAKIVNESQVDCALVGDSLAMVMHGYPSTLPATIELMELHTRAVSRGAPDKFIVSDMPFMSFRKGVQAGLENIEKLMRAGAHSVKIEGVWGHEDLISHAVESGVPVMGHLGLTPQSVNQFGGFKVQGRENAAAADLVKQAKELEKRGAFAVVLECVPQLLAQEISSALSIPTIGIGAGVGCDGQVLVLQDLLGAQKEFKPKFLRTFMDAASTMTEALNTFDREVKAKTFPNEKESYS